MGLKRFIKKHVIGEKAVKQAETSPLSLEEMERLLNSTVISLFEEYRSELLTKPPVYIVPAVWGEKMSGDLDATQKEIHRTLSPVLEETHQQITACETVTQGDSYTGYLLKGLLLYKMAYMVQYYMNQTGHGTVTGQEANSFLADMEPAGRA